MNDSGLPPNWVKAFLAEIAAINPKLFDEAPRDNELVSFVPMAAVEEESGKLNSSTLKCWKEVSKGYTRFQENDVLFAKITPCMENGKYALARDLHGGRGAGSTEFHVFRPTKAIDPRFLLFFFFQSELRRAARLSMRGAAGQLRVPPDFFQHLKIDLPPRPEQDHIVAEIEKQFTRLDDAVLALKRVQANLKRYRASVLKAACEGRLVPTEAELACKDGRDYEPASELLKRILEERRAKWEADQLQKMIEAGKPPKNDSWKKNYKEPEAADAADISKVPEGWTIASMDQLTTSITSGSRDWSPFYDRGSGVFIMAQNVRPGKFDLSFRQAVNPPENDASRARSAIAKNDLLVTIVGANTGDVCRVPDDVREHYVCQSVALMRPVFSDIARFLEVYMCSEENGQRQYRRYIYGAGRPHLSFDQLRMTAVLLPPVAEMRRILGEVEAKTSVLDSMSSIVEGQLRHAAVLRQAILRTAFSGKLVPQDPNDEPASVLLERIRAERAAAQAKNGKEKIPMATNGASSVRAQRRRRVAKLAQRVSAGKG